MDRKLYAVKIKPLHSVNTLVLLVETNTEWAARDMARELIPETSLRSLICSEDVSLVNGFEPRSAIECFLNDATNKC